MSTHFHVSGTGITGPLARRASDNYKWWVLITAIFCAFVSILDATVVNTALPHIQLAFGTDLHTASYVVTGYLLAQGVVIAASGFLANRFGIKRVYLLSLAFGAFPEEQRGLANGIFGIPVLVAPALGPVIGGYLAQYVDWRWIFYLNLPIGIIGIIICWRTMHESELQRTLPFDLRGFLLIASGLGLLLFGLSNLAYDGWGSLLTVTGPSILALLLLAAYIPIELRTAQPLLDLRLFKRRNYVVGSLITWVAFACLFGSTFLLPQYLQVLRGLSSFQAGLLLAPQGLASMVGTIVVGLLYSRLGARPLVIMGAIAVAFATYLMSQWLSLTSLFAELIPLLMVLGFGLPFLL